MTGDVQADLNLLLGAIDDIVADWDSLFSHSIQRLYARARETLAFSGVNIESVNGLQEVFEDVPHPFEGIETRYKQEKYFTEKLGLVVS